MNQPEAGDLTYAEGNYSCGTVLDLHQLRRVPIVIYLRCDFTTESRAMALSKPRNINT
jgi:hypothetical protein